MVVEYAILMYSAPGSQATKTYLDAAEEHLEISRLNPLEEMYCLGYWEIYKKVHLAKSRLEPWSVVDQVVRWRSGNVIDHTR